MLEFEMPKEQSSILKVIGIGGGGGNAVNHMHDQGIQGVNFIICNTDAQALANSKVPNKVQLGPHLTQGLGAGANPEIGREATEESFDEIKRILEVNTKMAFITAGMGGGTGTGGAPIVAKICKDLGILTVGIVTTPFSYEGKKRMSQANGGIERLKDNVDTLLVISNDKLRHQFGNLTMTAAFAKADNVLATAAKCITDIINSHGQMNVDFADVCTVMRNGGVAILGSAQCKGENRAQIAIEEALSSPLLDDNDIRGAKWILININSSRGENEFTMDEVSIIQSHLLSQAGEDSDVILGLGYDDTLEDRIGITLIATGFEQKDEKPQGNFEKKVKKEDEKIVMSLAPEEKKKASSPLFLFDEKSIKPSAETENPISDNTPEITSLQQDAIAASLKQTKDMDAEMMPRIESNNAEEKKTEKETIFWDFSLDKKENQPATEPIISSTNISEKNEKTGTSGGYLAKPSRLYVNEDEARKEPKPMKVEEEEKKEEILEMTLVEKEEDPGSIYIPSNGHLASSDSSFVDESADLRRKAEERINKLRNLSFNPNATAPHDEFENVPAYLRRNIELQNSIANVESFYTNYTVKTDETNKPQIGTINSYFNGNKPD